MADWASRSTDWAKPVPGAAKQSVNAAVNAVLLMDRSSHVVSLRRLATLMPALPGFWRSGLAAALGLYRVKPDRLYSGAKLDRLYLSGPAMQPQRRDAVAGLDGEVHERTGGATAE